MTVHRVDPRHRRVVARIAANGGSLAATGDAVWLLGMGNGVAGWLRRLDPAKSRLAGRPIRLASR
ncbi:MAG: hypothetical protein H0V79_13000 [Actinobacteria bacterium]|nr:hypothetical protein [Actinomycetota bacterium]